MCVCVCLKSERASDLFPVKLELKSRGSPSSFKPCVSVRSFTGSSSAAPARRPRRGGVAARLVTGRRAIGSGGRCLATRRLCACETSGRDSRAAIGCRVKRKPFISIASLSHSRFHWRSRLQMQIACKIKIALQAEVWRTQAHRFVARSRLVHWAGAWAARPSIDGRPSGRPFDSCDCIRALQWGIWPAPLHAG